MKFKKSIDTLKKASDAYYNNTPIMTDEEFDKLYEELKLKYPKDDYFKKVGAPTKSESVKLPFEMGSLNKINPYSAEDFIDGKSQYLVTPKFDGLTMQLVYKDGVLKEAYTRGDGIKGQPILNRALNIGGVVHKLPTTKKGIVEVEGEIIIYKSVFKKFYGNDYSHPRNFCVGTIRPSVTEKEFGNLIKQDESLKQRLHHLQFVAFKCRGVEEESKYSSLLTLKGWGFTTSIQPSKKWSDKNFKDYSKDGEDAICKCKKLKVPFKCLPYVKDLNSDWFKKAIDLVKSNKFDIACDGIVIEYDSLKKQEKLGNETNSLNPKFARAIKHIQQEQTSAVSVVKNITWNISKRGNFVPVVEIKPTNLEGSTISKVTANNYKQVKDMKIGIGSKVRFCRSGDIIPLILGVEKEGKVQVVKKCPYCKSTLVVKGVHLHCPNSKCEGRKLMEIQGFFQIAKADYVSTATIQDFVDYGFNTIKKILTIKVEDILEMDGYQKTSALKIVNSIKSMRSSVYLNTIMHALGCFNTAETGLGPTKLQVIINFLGADKIVNNTVSKSKLNKLTTLEGIAETSADLFTSKYELFQKKFQRIKSLFDFKDFEEVELDSNKLEGMSFCFTGARNKELESIIVQNGGTIKGSVTKDLTVLFSAGDSSKTSIAKQRGIKIVPFGKATDYINKLIK